MNQPQSVAAEKIALMILAGDNPATCKPLATPADFIPLSISDTTTWPSGGTTTLFTFMTPPNYGMVWTYISLYATLADESSAAVNYGINFSALFQLQARKLATGNFQPLSGAVLSQEIINKPVFFVFDTQTQPRLAITDNGSTQAVGTLRFEAEVSAYLVPAALLSVMRDHVMRLN
jgi:hypothetical protein